MASTCPDGGRRTAESSGFIGSPEITADHSCKPGRTGPAGYWQGPKAPVSALLVWGQSSAFSASTHGAPRGHIAIHAAAGRSPVDRGKQGMKHSFCTNDIQVQLNAGSVRQATQPDGRGHLANPLGGAH